MLTWILFLLVALTSPAQAVDLPEGQALALDAFQKEFVRAGVAGTRADRAAQFKAACDRGYPPACRRNTWQTPEGIPDLQLAVPLVSKPCDNGDAVACLVQAWALEEQAPSADDPARIWRHAARLLKVHCDAGFAPACHEYAFYLQENRGLTADPRAAALRWQAACEQGHLPSCTTLGTQQLNGAPGVPRNASAGLTQLQAACDAGDPQACYTWGKQRDRDWPAEEAHSFYGDLCDRGHRQSCWDLGVRYANGSLIAPEPDAAKGLLRKGCELDHASACHEAGVLAIAEEIPDYSQVSLLLHRGCQLGDSDACNELVGLFLEEHVEGGITTHRNAYEAACDKEDNLKACTHLATALIQGVHVPRDPDRGRELLQRSCTDATSSPTACTALGLAFEEGTGGNRDRTVAARYYQWACYAGRYDACDRRGDLLFNGVGIRRDDHEALAMFDRACRNDVYVACGKAATILDEATFVTRDLPRAAALYERACDNGIAAGCAGVGRLNEEGIDGAPNFKAARELYTRGIVLDDVECRRRLSRLLFNGLGGKKERRRARQLASEACQKGDAISCRGPAFL